VATIGRYSKAFEAPEEQVLLRLDGQYGTGAVIADLAGFCYMMRGKDYQVLDRAEVQSRLHLPPDQQFSRPESDLVRTLYDCPDVPVGPTGQRCRVVVATHPTSERKSRIGLIRSGLVHELFFTNLPQSAFTAADVVALYLYRGAFEPVLADEDQEQDPLRGAGPFRELPRLAGSVASPSAELMKVLCSDRSASPSEALWLLAPDLLRFLSPAARFSPSAAVSSNPFEGYVSLRSACIPSLND
jgi:hypothetical protein